MKEMQEPESMLRTKQKIAADNDKIQQYLQNEYVYKEHSKVKISDFLYKFNFLYKKKMTLQDLEKYFTNMTKL